MTGEQQAIAVAPVLLVMPYVVGRGVNSTTTAKRFPFLVYHRSRQLPDIHKSTKSFRAKTTTKDIFQ